MNQRISRANYERLSHHNGFVADGATRLLRSRWYQEKAALIRSEIEHRYAAERAQAEYWQRLAIDSKIQRDLDAELRKLASPYSLWVRHT